VKRVKGRHKLFRHWGPTDMCWMFHVGRARGAKPMKIKHRCRADRRKDGGIKWWCPVCAHYVNPDSQTTIPRLPRPRRTRNMI
jgi:hypothetical protein